MEAPKPFDDGVTGRLNIVGGNVTVEVKQSITKEGGTTVSAGTVWKPANPFLIKQVSDLATSALNVTLLDADATGEEHSGGNVNYYVVPIRQPKRKEFRPYYAECEDIIVHLGMTFSEGCAFKAIWRSAAARTLGRLKKGGDAIYDAEKVVHYGQLMLKERLMFQQSLPKMTYTPPIKLTTPVSTNVGVVRLTTDSGEVSHE